MIVVTDSLSLCNPHLLYFENLCVVNGNIRGFAFNPCFEAKHIAIRSLGLASTLSWCDRQMNRMNERRKEL